MSKNPPTAAGSLAAMLGLEQQLRKAASQAQLSFTIVNQTQSCVPYAQAVLLLGSDPKNWRVCAASDISSVDHTSPYVVWIEQLVRERNTSGGEPVQAMLQPKDVAEGLVASWSEMAPGHLLWQPLTVEARGGETNGLLLLFRDQAWTDSERSLMAHLANSMGHALFALRRVDPMRHVRRLAKSRRATMGVLAGLFVLMVWPVRLSALAPVEVIAQDPMVISAPMEGAIREIDRGALHPQAVPLPVEAAVPSHLAGGHGAVHHGTAGAEAFLLPQAGHLHPLG